MRYICGTLLLARWTAAGSRSYSSTHASEMAHDAFYDYVRVQVTSKVLELDWPESRPPALIVLNNGPNPSGRVQRLEDQMKPDHSHARDGR